MRSPPSGAAALLLAVTLFGLSHSVVAKLSDIGAAAAMGGHNPISFCNVLFAGNVVAGLSLAALQRKDLTRACWASLGRREITALFVVGVLSGALAPALLFSALARTSVTDVVLLGRLQAPFLFAFSVALLGVRPPLGVVLSEVLILAGVGLMLFIDSWGLLTSGQLLAICGALSLAAGTLISQSQLSHVPQGVVMVTRTFIGAVTFFCVAITLYGPQHFADLGAPVLWQWMLLYGGVIVAVGQLAWARGLATTPHSLAAVLEALLPITGVLGALLLLGEHPSIGQKAGLPLVSLGVALGAITWWRAGRPPKKEALGMGFRGA